MTLIPLTVYGTASVASTLSTANTLVAAAGGSSTTRDIKIGATPSGFGQLCAQGNTSAWPSLSVIGAPDGRGWFLESLSLAGYTIISGDWLPSLRLQVAGGGTPNIVADLYMRAFKYNAGIYTPIGSMLKSAESLTSATANHPFNATALAFAKFLAGDILYIDAWLYFISASGLVTASAFRLSESASSTTGVNNNVSLTTPGYQPTVTPGVVQPLLPTCLSSILNIRNFGWNPIADYKGKFVDTYGAAPAKGGLYINWQYDDPTNTNVQGNGSDDQEVYQAGHDALTCLRYLLCMSKYAQLVTAELPELDNLAWPDMRLTIWIWHIYLDFYKYATPKGIVYFSLLEIGHALQHSLMLQLAQSVADGFMNSYRSGYFWTYRSTNAHYSTNATAGVCAAVLDTAYRYPGHIYNNTATGLVQNAAAFIAAAKSGMDHLLSVCREPVYGLFYDNMNVSYDVDGSSDTPILIDHTTDQYNSRASTSAEVAEHLLKMAAILGDSRNAAIHPDLYDPTRAATYQNAAYTVLNNLYALLWDSGADESVLGQRGGYYFAIVMQGSFPAGPYTYTVTKDYKETRATCAAVRAYCQAKRNGSSAYDTPLAQCMSVLLDDKKFLKYSAWCGYGYVYRTYPYWDFYVTRPGQGVGWEGYVTTEAIGASVECLLSAYMLTTVRPLAQDSIAVGRNCQARNTARGGKVTAVGRSGQQKVTGRSGRVLGVARPGTGGP